MKRAEIYNSRKTRIRSSWREFDVSKIGFLFTSFFIVSRAGLGALYYYIVFSMPLFKRKMFPLVEPPEDIKPNEQVFQI